MGMEQLTHDEKSICITAINHCGLGQHPAAGMHNITYFQPPYVKKCVNKLLKKGWLNEEGEKLAKSALFKL